MAQHDYVIANGTGAATRADLNNGLAAIVSNNSGATEPATMYAYQWWADTTTGLLKLRNAANSAWVTVGTLASANLGLAALASPTFTGTVTAPTFTASTAVNIPLGSAGSPTLFFTGDTNTGLFSPGADAIALATAGTNRLHITSSGNVGIGTTGPQSLLHLGSSSGDIPIPTGNFATIRAGTYASASTAGIQLSGGYGDSGTTGAFNIKAIASGSGGFVGTNALAITTTTAFAGVETEHARIDSSGRLLIGTSTARANFFNSTVSPLIQQEGVSGSSRFAAITYGTNAEDDPIFILGKHRGASVGGTTVVNSGDGLGKISFQGSDGTEFVEGAAIRAEVDGTPGANDMPGRLVFSTTADGASSPTERMRITNSGHLKLSNTGSYREASVSYNEVTQSVADKPVWLMQATSGSYAEQVHVVGVVRSANAAYNFFTAYSGDGSSAFNDLEFRLSGNGNGTCDGAWTGGGADYAEYFEWSDGNPDEEDRRGISVVLDGEKIRPAEEGEDPIGVISGNPSVVGDAAWNKWNGKYLRDDFGTYIQEDYEVVNDEGETVIQQRRKLNPAYDPDQEYTPREQRPEWDCVGLMGKLRIRKGQPTGSRWIKMRDISDSVEEWLVR